MSTNTVYVVTSIYSPYKEDIEDSSVQSYVFSTFNKAQEVMMKIAKNNYRDLEEYDASFFYEGDDSILYGEDEEYGVSYRRAWGLVKIEKVVMNAF